MKLLILTKIITEIFECRIQTEMEKSIPHTSSFNHMFD